MAEKRVEATNQRHSHNDQDFLDAPPPYEVHSSGEFLSTAATIEPDGTLHVELSSSKPSELQGLLPAPPEPVQPESPPGPCPQLNLVVHVVGSRLPSNLMRL